MKYTDINMELRHAFEFVCIVLVLLVLSFL